MEDDCRAERGEFDHQPGWRITTGRGGVSLTASTMQEGWKMTAGWGMTAGRGGVSLTASTSKRCGR